MTPIPQARGKSWRAGRSVGWKDACFVQSAWGRVRHLHRPCYRWPRKGALTTANGLDDGSKYSPDGRYIYFRTHGQDADLALDARRQRAGAGYLWRNQ